MKEEFGEGVNINEEEFLDKDSQKKKLSMKILLIAVILWIGVFLITIIIFLNRDKSKKSNVNINNKLNYSEIICLYDIQEKEQNIQILGNNFKNDTAIDILVNGIKITYGQKALFESIGIYEIKYIIYGDELNMNYMFKDIDSLISVKLLSTINTTEKSIYITSMISTFENCKNLKTFENLGFNFEKVPSMHKLFYKADLSDVKELELNLGI